MSSLEEENENAIWMIYYSFYLWVKNAAIFWKWKSISVNPFNFELWYIFASTQLSIKDKGLRSCGLRIEELLGHYGALKVPHSQFLVQTGLCAHPHVWLGLCQVLQFLPLVRCNLKTLKDFPI